MSTPTIPRNTMASTGTFSVVSPQSSRRALMSLPLERTANRPSWAWLATSDAMVALLVLTIPAPYGWHLRGAWPLDFSMVFVAAGLLVTMAAVEWRASHPEVDRAERAHGPVSDRSPVAARSD